MSELEISCLILNKAGHRIGSIDGKIQQGRNNAPSVSDEEAGKFLNIPADEFLTAVNRLIFDKFDRELKAHGNNLSATAKCFGMTNTRFERVKNKAQNFEAI